MGHRLAAAGNASLMSDELKATLADHAAGNYRVLMNLADELLTVAADRDQSALADRQNGRAVPGAGMVRFYR